MNHTTCYRHASSCTRATAADAFSKMVVIVSQNRATMNIDIDFLEYKLCTARPSGNFPNTRVNVQPLKV